MPVYRKKKGSDTWTGAEIAPIGPPRIMTKDILSLVLASFVMNVSQKIVREIVENS